MIKSWVWVPGNTLTETMNLPSSHQRYILVCFLLWNRFGEMYCYITCSPTDPLQWMGAVRMRVQITDKNNGPLLFTSKDVNWWSGVMWITYGLVWCFYQLFGLWRQPFAYHQSYWWLSDEMLNFSKSWIFEYILKVITQITIATMRFCLNRLGMVLTKKWI